MQCILATDEEEAEFASEPGLPCAVVFLLPHIVSTDRVEQCLSTMVAAGAMECTIHAESSLQPYDVYFGITQA